MTLIGHWPAEDIYVGWLNGFYVMYALPRWQVPFFAWHWPYHSPTQSDYEKLAQRVAGFVPELESALREGKLGRHMRRFSIPAHRYTARANRYCCLTESESLSRAADFKRGGGGEGRF
jgi:hypothetical protein